MPLGLVIFVSVGRLKITGFVKLIAPIHLCIHLEGLVFRATQVASLARLERIPDVTNVQLPITTTRILVFRRVPMERLLILIDIAHAILLV